MIIASKMKKNGKKYLIRESELKEIIQEMLLMELYNPDDYKDMYQKGTSDAPLPNLGDAIGGVWNIVKGIPAALIPDKFKEQVANGNGNLGNDFMQWFMNAIGASAAGTSGADWVPNIGQRRGEGQNKDAHEQLNVAAACNWLATNAKAKSTRWCAKYVRIALNRGGLSLPYGMYAPSAKYYVNILPANGWDEIPAAQAGQPCDVIVVDETWSIRREHYYKDGHIAMCIGNGRWASDFLQGSPSGLKYAVPPERIHFYRYRNRI